MLLTNKSEIIFLDRQFNQLISAYMAITGNFVVGGSLVRL